MDIDRFLTFFGAKPTETSYLCALCDSARDNCFSPTSLESAETRSGFLSGRRPTETCFLCALCDSARDNCFSPSLSRESGLRSRVQRRGVGFFLGEGPLKHVISVLSATLREIIVSRPVYPENRDFARERRGAEGGSFWAKPTETCCLCALCDSARDNCFSPTSLESAETRSGFLSGRRPTETCFLCALCDSARDNCFSPTSLEGAETRSGFDF